MEGTIMNESYCTGGQGTYRSLVAVKAQCTILLPQIWPLAQNNAYPKLIVCAHLVAFPSFCPHLILLIIRGIFKKCTHGT